MSGQPYVRPPGELHDLSVSRIKKIDTCGLAFRYQYVDGLSAASESAAMLFGNVIHDAVDLWYGKEDSDEWQRSSLKEYVRERWSEYLPSNIATILQRCLVLDEQLDAVSQALLITRPDLKAPRQTKAFLESQEFKLFEDQRDELLKRCEANETMTWPKDENPIQAYYKSLVIADQLQARWQPQPRPLVVEYPFRLEFEGFNIRGRIDQIRDDPTSQGEVLNELLDIKTGRQKMTQMEAFLQAFIYDEACYRDDTLPTPDHVTFWLARWNAPQIGRIDRERHRALALRILNSTARRIITGDYQPSYGMHCRYCDFKPLCEQEISLWPVGSDSLVLEPA